VTQKKDRHFRIRFHDLLLLSIFNTNEGIHVKEGIVVNILVKLPAGESETISGRIDGRFVDFLQILQFLPGLYGAQGKHSFSQFQFLDKPGRLILPGI
jgi:hypothetical protein